MLEWNRDGWTAVELAMDILRPNAIRLDQRGLLDARHIPAAATRWRMK